MRSVYVFMRESKVEGDRDVEILGFREAIPTLESLRSSNIGGYYREYSDYDVEEMLCGEFVDTEDGCLIYYEDVRKIQTKGMFE